MQNGWIKLHRQMTKNDLWHDKPFSRGQAWIDLLLQTNHEDGGFWKRGTFVKVKRGQTGRSEVSLAADWGWSRNKVRRFIDMLKNRRMIEQETGHLISVISICNYDKYNPATEQQTEQQVKHLKDSRRNINKNEKKEKKSIRAITAKTEFEQTLEEFKTHRKQLKRPMTAKAFDLLRARLEELAPQNAPRQIAILNQSIEYGWIGVFDLKDQEDAAPRRNKVLELLRHNEERRNASDR